MAKAEEPLGVDREGGSGLPPIAAGPSIVDPFVEQAPHRGERCLAGEVLAIAEPDTPRRVARAIGIGNEAYTPGPAESVAPAQGGGLATVGDRDEAVPGPSRRARVARRSGGLSV